MIPSPGVVQSVDANLVNISECWIWSDVDIYSQDYSQVLVQPLSLEANDLSELKFIAPVSILTIRRGYLPTSPFVWNGVSVNVEDPNQGSPVTPPSGTVTSVDLVTPDIFTVTTPPVTSSGILGFEWNDSPSNVVLGDGTTKPLSELDYFTYYNSTSKIFATNTIASINLVPGIKTVYANTVQSPNVINVKGSGTIKWHTLTNACILSLQANGTNLAIIQLTGTRILPGGLTNRDYFLDIDIDIVLLNSATVIVTGSVEINDTYVKASTWIEEEIALDTTVDVILSCNASWVNAQANNSVIISKLVVAPLYNPITIVTPTADYDGGYSYTIYTVSPIDGGASNTVYSLPPINGGTSA